MFVYVNLVEFVFYFFLNALRTRFFLSNFRSFVSISAECGVFTASMWLGGIYYFANLAVQMLKCGLMAALQPLQHKTIVIEL